MANVITAGNSTNGGTSVATDTSGTLNIVTGSGSGANAITIDASQNVTVAGTLTGSSSITGTNLIGQSQTWQTVTRASGTTYTNTTGRPIMLSVAQSTAGISTFTVTINGSALPALFASPSGTFGGFTIIIPVGATYVYTNTIGTGNAAEFR